MLSIVQAVLKRRWFVLGIVSASTTLALLLSLVIPKKYLSETSVLPANSQLNDKTRFFSENMRELYSGFGTADDLDRLYATARSGITFNALIDSFKLVDHYGLQKKGVIARDAATRKLRTNSYILKSEYGELKIGVWDNNPAFAADLANAFINTVQRVNQGMFTEFYAATLQKLEADLQTRESELHANISHNRDSATNKINQEETRWKSSALVEDVNRYRKIIAEYRIAMLNPPPSLIVLEKAHPSVRVDKPNILLNTLAAFLVSSFIAVLLSVIIFKKEN